MEVKISGKPDDITDVINTLWNSLTESKLIQVSYLSAERARFSWKRKENEFLVSCNANSICIEFPSPDTGVFKD
jgi:hypothetical protein